MPRKSHIIDYQSVTRSGTPSQAEDAEFDGWRGPGRSAPDRGSKQASEAGDVRLRSESQPRGKVSRTKETILRRGHTLSYVGLVAFTGLVYFRPYEVFPSLKWASSSAFIVAVFTLLVYVPTQLGLEGKFTIRAREINLALLLLLMGLLSVPFALDRSVAWPAFVEFLKVILMFIVMVNVVRSEARIRILILLILVVSCWMSVAAINDYRLGRFALPGERIEGIIGGLFDNPNDMALHLVTMIPLTVAFFLSSRRFIGKLIYPICVGLMIAGIVASFSRGGFLGLVCATGVMMWRLARRNRTLFLAIAFVLCMAFLALAPSDYRQRIATTGDGSSVQRQNDLKRSIVIMLHHPLLGVGMDNYVLFSNSNHATHNAYTQVGAEMGIPAMVVYIMIMLAALKPLRNIARETVNAKRKSRASRFHYLAAGLEASLIGYMVSSFFASVAYLWYLYYLVAYAVCLARLYQAYQSAQATAAIADGSPGQGRPEAAGRILAPKPAPSLSIT